MAGRCCHGRVQRMCKDCGGSGICEHGRQRHICKACGGSQVCVHDRRRARCVACHGGSICEHDRLRARCKLCDGTSLCIHKRQRSHCKQCGGKSICIHNRRRDTCKPCGGASICPHDRRRTACNICLPADWMVHRKAFCISCFKRLSPERIKVSVRACGECSNSKLPRVEMIVRDLLFPLMQDCPPSAIDDRSLPLGGTTCGMDRSVYPDVLWQLSDRTVVLEIDENSHARGNYTPSCDLKRASDLVEATHRVMGRVVPVFIVRFNPNAYDGSVVNLSARIEALAQLLNKLINCDLSFYNPAIPHMWYLYYHSNASDFVQAAVDASPDVQVHTTM